MKRERERERERGRERERERERALHPCLCVNQYFSRTLGELIKDDHKMSLSDFLLVNGNGKRIENSRTVGKAKDRFLNRRAYQLIRSFYFILF